MPMTCQLNKHNSTFVWKHCLFAVFKQFLSGHMHTLCTYFLYAFEKLRLALQICNSSPFNIWLRLAQVGFSFVQDPAQASAEARAEKPTC